MLVFLNAVGWAGTSIAEYVKSNSEPNLFGASADSVENQLHTVIEGMLCRDPDDRPPIKSVAEQLQALKSKMILTYGFW